MERYVVSGMRCAACAARVEKTVKGVSGVTDCTVNLLTGDLAVSGTASSQEILGALGAIGYPTKTEEAARAEETAENVDRYADTELPRLKRRLLLSLCLLLPLMLLSMGPMIGLSLLADQLILSAILQGVGALGVMLLNRSFFLHGARALFQGAPSMDTLVALGSASAFGYSLVVLLIALISQSPLPAHSLYFESAAMILTLITVGKLLEARAKGKTTSALRALMSLSPKQATVVRNGEQVRVPIEQVAVGDRFVVMPGEVIPVDGVVEQGESSVNESALTGESIPVDKQVGSAVSAASLNQSGHLVCVASRVGDDTTLARIIRLVEEVSATKAPIAKLADRVSAVFVPIVIGIALLTLILHLALSATIGEALTHAVAVLVVSCPCALGLATPTAIMVGSGVGARVGILFKSAEALERAGRIRAIALDKTGTITRGKPMVTDVICLPGEEGALLSLACSLEAKSEHPLARAIVEYGAEHGVGLEEAEGFRGVAGGGVYARVSGKEACGGNAAFVSGYAEIAESWREQMEATASMGKTTVLFAEEGQVKGILALSDEPKSDSAEAIALLDEMGIRVVMLTGDSVNVARAIGEKVGVCEIRAGILPQEKAEAVEELCAKYGAVAMVGDGINDAPALGRADLGMAIGAGTDIAIDAAQVVLMNDSLLGAAQAIRLGRETLKTIRQNLFWAFCYNMLAIPIAAGAFGFSMSPMIGAAAMSLSSFCVVTNALRLNLVRLPRGKEEGEERELRIVGMMCEHCENRVREALLRLPGVRRVESVEHTSGKARLVCDPELRMAALKDAVKQAGYRVRG